MTLYHICTWLTLVTRLSWLYLWHRSDRTAFYDNALQLLRQNNILFTKVFQSLTNSSHLDLDTELRTRLRSYTTNVSYREDEINHECIDQIETTHNVRIERRVVNSGMIALVFRGERVDTGEPVILKLKRRDIDLHPRNGCEAMQIAYRIAAYMYPQNIFIRVLRAFIENLDDILEQCDFSNEITNTREAKEDFADLAFVKIPTVYNDPEEGVEYILMEYIVGSHTMPANKTQAERLQYLHQLCVFNSFGLISNSMQHTDLHSGNILFTDT